jgi:hypothetical protein
MEPEMGKAEEASVGLSGLLERRSSTSPDRPRLGGVIEPSRWLAEMVGDVRERLRELRRPASEANDF